MQVNETSAEGLKREFTVVVPSNDVESSVVERLTEIGNSVSIPGFRPGKVPIALLKKRYGEAVKGEVLEKTVQDSWQQALTEKGLRPAAQPKVEIVTFEDGVDLEYTLAVELLPEIDPIDFSKIDFKIIIVYCFRNFVDDFLHSFSYKIVKRSNVGFNERVLTKIFFHDQMFVMSHLIILKEGLIRETLVSFIQQHGNRC